MGLDMYLHKRTHVDLEKKNKRTQLAEIFDDEKLKEIPEYYINIQYMEEVGYWRKANHIHHWFVQNVQNGVDDCDHYVVSRKKLEELRQICMNVLENREDAAAFLPTSSGFFFGDVKYNDYYFDQIERTIDIVSVILISDTLDNDCVLGRSCEYVYHASW